MNRDVIAYTAGIVDGEGYIGLNKGTYYNLHIKVVNTNIHVLKWLQCKWGGSVTIHQRHISYKWRTPFRWVLTGQKALECLRQISPLLIIKKQEAQCVLNQWKAGTSDGREVIWRQLIQLRAITIGTYEKQKRELT